MIVTSQVVAQYFSCPRKAYYLYHEGCHTGIMASSLREHMRVTREFLRQFSYKNHYTINQSDVKSAVAQTKEVLSSTNYRDDGGIIHALFSSTDELYAYVPLCTWHKKLDGWILHFCMASTGLRSEHKIHAACALYESGKMNIPVVGITQHFLIDTEEGIQERDRHVGSCWIKSDITTKVENYLHATKLREFLDFVYSSRAQDIENWEKCSKKYCDVCENEEKDTVFDVRTLRKSKFIVSALLKDGITNINDIPPTMELQPTTQRQVDAVKERSTLFFADEVRQFLQQLAYPRYYLDFEAFSTSVPFFEGVKVNGFVPFLFSLQWQEHEHSKIHTQLWAMPYGSDKRHEMWRELSKCFSQAGSIVVYNSSFEEEMIKQLARGVNQRKEGNFYISKLVDLQSVFLNLSVYKPEQKGKISLKKITSLWLGGDYSKLKISDGMLANYFYTMHTDKKRDTFKELRKSPYMANLFEKIKYFDNQHDIELKDIAQYCKYDTQVMIQIVALLENMYVEHVQNGSV